MRLIESKEYPPNFHEIKELFPELAERGIFTWGITIYNPKGYTLDPGLLRHEEMHSIQQVEYGGEKIKYRILPKQRVRDWWTRYLKDESFRFAMEIPAYQVQYWEYEAVLKEKEQLNKVRIALAKDLASKFYGKRVNIDEAIKILKAPQIYNFKFGV